MPEVNFSRLKFCCSLLILLAMVISTGCLAGRAAPRTFDIAEIVAGTPNLLVTDFKWEYFNEGVHLKITGEVLNATGAPIQSGSIYGVLYDEYDRPIGQGDSFIYPVYLKEGARGAFEFTVMNGMSNRIATNIRLVTSAKTGGR